MRIRIDIKLRRYLRGKLSKWHPQELDIDQIAKDLGLIKTECLKKSLKRLETLGIILYYDPKKRKRKGYVLGNLLGSFTLPDNTPVLEWVEIEMDYISSLNDVGKQQYLMKYYSIDPDLILSKIGPALELMLTQRLFQHIVS